MNASMILTRPLGGNWKNGGNDMKAAVKYIFEANPLWVYLKKHYCPVCGEKLEVRFSSKMICATSPEAKHYDLSLGDSFLVGDVEFKEKCFFCSKCAKNITFNEIKKSEK